MAATATKEAVARKSAKAKAQQPQELRPLPATQLPFLRGLISHVRYFDKMISLHVRYADPTSLSGASTIELKCFDVQAFQGLEVDQDILVEYSPRLRQRKDNNEWETTNVVSEINWF